MKNLFSLLLSFLKVGIIGFGGGSALIPVIEKEIVTNKKMLSEKEYYNHVIIANITPGTLPVKLAAAAGKSIHGIPGMIGSAIMVSLPGVAIMLFLISILSQLNDNLLHQIEFASVGISVFIILLLVLYIKKIFQGCKITGTSLPSYSIMILVFLLTSGKEIYEFFSLSVTPIFDISTLNILLLAFFIIFFTQGKLTKGKGVTTGVISLLYISCTGKSNLILKMISGLPYSSIINETIVTLLYLSMILLSCFGIYKSIQTSKGTKKLSIKYLIKDELSWLVLLIVLSIPALILFTGLFDYLGKGIVSTIISFGGGEAYLSIADGIFVSSNIIPANVFYGQILPVANALPGPILSKLLSAIGFHIGFTATNSIFVGLMVALAGYAASLMATCSIFFLILHIYNRYESLDIFQVLKKWILPIVCGLLCSTILSMLSANFDIISLVGAAKGTAFFICVTIFLLLYWLHKRFHLHDILLIIVSGFASIIICNLI